MRRRSLLGLLGLPLAAQDEEMVVANTPDWETKHRPRNGQCPVCAHLVGEADELIGTYGHFKFYRCSGCFGLIISKD